VDPPPAVDVAPGDVEDEDGDDDGEDDDSPDDGDDDH
jgi:hypothetical protein